jgi:hypothetical protein
MIDALFNVAVFATLALCIVGFGAWRASEFRDARKALGLWFGRCPLCPRKRTSLSGIAMSALCQKRTHALQQSMPAYSGRSDEFSPLAAVFELLLIWLATALARRRSIDVR